MQDTHPHQLADSAAHDVWEVRMVSKHLRIVMETPKAYTGNSVLVPGFVLYMIVAGFFFTP